MKIIICIALILYLISTQNQLSTATATATNSFVKVSPLVKKGSPPSINNLIFYSFNLNVILNN